MVSLYYADYLYLGFRSFFKLGWVRKIGRLLKKGTGDPLPLVGKHSLPLLLYGKIESSVALLEFLENIRFNLGLAITALWCGFKDPCLISVHMGMRKSSKIMFIFAKQINNSAGIHISSLWICLKGPDSNPTFQISVMKIAFIPPSDIGVAFKTAEILSVCAWNKPIQRCLSCPRSHVMHT